MALFAHRYNIQDYHNYKIHYLGNTFRGLHVLKNRDGDDNAFVGVEI